MRAVITRALAMLMAAGMAATVAEAAVPSVADMPLAGSPAMHRHMAAARFPAATVPRLARSVSPVLLPAAPQPAMPQPAEPQAAETQAAEPQPGARFPLTPLPPAYVPPAQAPQPAAAAPQPAAAAPSAISLEAGTGLLLHLPAAAATIMSAQPSIARVQPASPTSLFLMATAPGRTTVIAAGPGGTPIAQYDVTVTPGQGDTATGPAGAPNGAATEPTTVTPAMAAAAQAAIDQSVVGAQLVRAKAAGRSIILTGTVATAQMAQAAVSIAQGYIGSKLEVADHMLVLGSIQVNVRVRIAEIDRTVTRQLGFNWQAFGSGTAGSGAFHIGSLTAPLANLTQAAPFAASGIGAGAWDVNSVIDALAQDQLVSILAEPNLTAQSGETASFLAGGEFPVPVAAQSSNGSPSITVAFKQFGVSLALVPTVLAPNRLNLRIRPEVSQLSTQGEVSVPLGSGVLTIPALSVRRAETTIELGSGQSFAIAGLLQKSTVDQSNALPGLGELPVLGALFKSTAFQHGQSELVIIVTPYIVRPASTPAALRTPLDHFRPATDLDRILFGRQLAKVPAGLRTLDAGFILK